MPAMCLRDDLIWQIGAGCPRIEVISRQQAAEMGGAERAVLTKFV